MTGLEDDEYEIPLRDQRYFGAGIKRKRVQFVPSSSTQSATTSLPAPASSTAARRYLEIVFGKRNDANSEPQASHAPREASRGTGDATGLDSRVERAREHTEASESTRSQSICDVCTRPIYDSATAILHQSSISHQICLQHSHGPSHVDRKRKGLQVLSTQGWDPDSRLGLGAEGEGILHPIKAKENPERAGLGVRPEDVAKARAKEKFANLDAGKVRKLEAEKKKRGQSLRDAFYRSEDVEKYLCGG